MGADICAFVALYAVFFIPLGHEGCHTAFFVGCSAVFPCSVGDGCEVGDFKQVAVLGVDGAHDFVDEFGIVVGGVCFNGEVRPCGFDSELLVFAATVNGCIVLVNDILSLLAIALDDEFLHLLNSQVNGDHFSDAEECALENGVGAVAQPDFLCDFGGVDVVDGDVVVSEIFLDFCGEVLGQFLAFPDCVEQEGAVVAQTACHIIHVKVGLYVTCHEVRGVHQVCGAYWRVAETEVRAGEAARFLRVVGEICLAVLACVVADNFDGVLVCANCAVGSEAVEFGFIGALVAERHLFGEGEGCKGHIVDDAYGEVVFGHGECEVLEHADNLCRGGVFRGQAIASAYYDGGVFFAIEALFYIEEQGLAVGTWFFCAVKDCDAFGCCWHCGEEVFCREGAIEVD